MKTTKKITLATIKAFVNKNRNKLLIRNKSRFYDGMVDYVSEKPAAHFEPIKQTDDDHTSKNTLGIVGFWLVLGSSDYFTAFEQDGLTGINVYNCCGSFDVAIKTGD